MRAAALSRFRRTPMTTSAESARTARVRPTAAFMRPKLSRWIALGFGCGLSPWAPGTVGTLWAWVAWLAFAPWLTVPAQFVLIGLGFVVGVWACGRTADALGVQDHGGIVWDEVVAFWLVLAFIPTSIGEQCAAFLLFRFFDIVKPPPIRQLDRSVPGGFGVMLDDLLAAFYTLLALALWRAW